MSLVPSLNEELYIEIIKGNGMVNLIFKAHSTDEVCYTISAEAFALLAKDLQELVERENGYRTAAYDLYANELPLGDDE